MTESLALFFGAVIVDNFVLTRFLGLCPFIGVSSRLGAAVGMGIATTIVLALASVCCLLVNTRVLAPLGLGSLSLILDILVIAAMVQLVEILIHRLSFALYTALGIYLPLITTNCIVLGLVLLNESMSLNLGQSLIHALGAGTGFTLVLAIFSAIRERLAAADVPEPFRGTPVALLTAGLLAMAFMGFAGFAGSAA
ncbi:MAG: RnfABCDGE type electron transport complex subunit A [Succinivibrionaceae bacterium]|nr:RnfABCDGE type electron transport complex subunit A [Succinivibrionaceae bacterium]